MESTITNEQVVALAKVISKESFSQASKRLGVGIHEVDFVFRVSGTFKKGKDYEQRFVAKADPWGLLAVALSKLNGVTVESLVRDHLKLTEEDKDFIKERADRALQEIKDPTVSVANGKISSVKIEAETIPVVAVDDLGNLHGVVAVDVA